MSAIKVIQTGLKQLGIEQEDARDLYENVTGLRSLRAMNDTQRLWVINDLRDKGFKKISNGTRTLLTGKFAKKLQALWIACWNMGIIKQSSDEALLAFVKRQTGLDHTRFMHHAVDAEKVIEALKGMLAREGVDWSNLSTRDDWQRVEGYRISIAQWENIVGRMDRNSYDDFLAFCSLHGGHDDFRELRNPDYIPVMNGLGKQIRESNAG